MQNLYIITITAHRDIMGQPCNQLRYAIHDTCGAFSPEWGFSCYDAKLFQSVGAAQEWFENNKTYLLADRFDKYKFDMSSLAIQKIVYEKVASLNA